MPDLERRSSAVEGHIYRESQYSGEHLWKGVPFRVAESITLHPGITNVTFYIDDSMFRYGSLQEALEQEEGEEGIHIRSRWAHVFIDGPQKVNLLLLAYQQREKLQAQEHKIFLPFENKGDVDVDLNEGDEVLHSFFVPDNAITEGAELGAIIGNHPELGRNVVIAYRTNEVGEWIETGVFAKARPERFWIPKSDRPLSVGNYLSFEEMRKELFPNYFKRTDDENFPMPDGHPYVAAMPDIQLPQDKYIVIERQAYIRNDKDIFEPCGSHQLSPLVEGRSNDHGHNLELEKGEWIYFRIVQNGEELKAG